MPERRAGFNPPRRVLYALKCRADSQPAARTYLGRLKPALHAGAPLSSAPSAGSRSLPSRSRPSRRRAPARAPPAFSSTLAGRRPILGLPATRSALAPAARHLVLGRPGAPLRFFLGDATLLVALLDMLGLTFLLIAVGGFVTSGHGRSFPARFAPSSPTGCKWNTAAMSKLRNCSPRRARAARATSTCPRSARSGASASAQTVATPHVHHGKQCSPPSACFHQRD